MTEEEMEEVSRAKPIANGIIIMYMICTLVAIVTGTVGVPWGILAILIMTVLTYGITPAYPEIILIFNYALFASLVLVSLLIWGGIPLEAFFTLMVFAGPLIVIGIPITHILYLARQERKIVPKKKITRIRKKPRKQVSGRIGRSFALLCGYETLRPKHAFGLLFLRTALMWIITSIVILVVSKMLGII